MTKLKKPKDISQQDWDDMDSPEWEIKDFAQANLAKAVLPKLVGKKTAGVMLRPRGRPPAEVHKIATSIRLDEDILAAFKSSGKGWQTRMNAALKDWLQEHHLPMR